MKTDDNNVKKGKKPATPRKTKGKPGAGREMPRSDLLKLYSAAHPDSMVVKLMEANRIGVWRSDTDSYVVFVRVPKIKDLETLIGELTGDFSAKFTIDTKDEVIKGMSFRASDCQGYTYYMLALIDKPGCRAGIPVLAHEATHTAVNILNDHRMTLDADMGKGGHVGEPLAHLIGTLVEFGMRTLWGGPAPDEPDDPITKMIRKFQAQSGTPDKSHARPK